MEGKTVESPLISRPELIKMTGSKLLVDMATHSGKLPVIRVGKTDSKRPRHLYLRSDVTAWLEGLRDREGQ